MMMAVKEARHTMLQIINAAKQAGKSLTTDVAAEISEARHHYRQCLRNYMNTLTQQYGYTD